MCALASKDFEGARAGSAAVEKDITPMVVARFKGLAMVIFGNRRLYALKEFARQRRHQVFAQALVHCEPFHHLRELKDRFLLKCTTAISTENGGEYAVLGRGRPQ